MSIASEEKSPIIKGCQGHRVLLYYPFQDRKRHNLAVLDFFSDGSTELCWFLRNMKNTKWDMLIFFRKREVLIKVTNWDFKQNHCFANQHEASCKLVTRGGSVGLESKSQCFKWSKVFKHVFCLIGGVINWLFYCLYVLSIRKNVYN